jgi:hypothetical protein
MKKIIIVSLLFLALSGCKKNGMSPEGPTDVRIRNISEVTFTGVIIGTSEKTEDVATIGNIVSGAVSEYTRFKKAYPKAEITVHINTGGSDTEFSTGEVDYTYMNYIGQDRITFEVYISDFNNRQLSIKNVVLDEPLKLK